MKKLIYTNLMILIYLFTMMTECYACDQDPNVMIGLQRFGSYYLNVKDGGHFCSLSYDPDDGSEEETHIGITAWAWQIRQIDDYYNVVYDDEGGGPHLDYIFQNAGIYEVYLWVKDNDSTSWHGLASKTVYVSAVDAPFCTFDGINYSGVDEPTVYVPVNGSVMLSPNGYPSYIYFRSGSPIWTISPSGPVISYYSTGCGEGGSNSDLVLVANFPDTSTYTLTAKAGPNDPGKSIDIQPVGVNLRTDINGDSVIDSADDTGENDPGGYIGVNKSRKLLKFNISPLEKLSDGEVWIILNHGDYYADLYLSETGGIPGFDCYYWNLGDSEARASFQNYLTNGIYIQGVNASSSLRDIEVSFEYYRPNTYYPNYLVYDTVNLTCLGVQITDSSDNVITSDINITVGEKVELHTKIEPEGIEPSEWYWMFSEAIVGNYANGILTPVDNNDSQVQFFWVENSQQDPYESYAGVGCKFGKASFTDTVTFLVKKPTYTQSTPAYSNVYIDNFKIRMHIGDGATVNQGTASNGQVKTVQVVKEYAERTKIADGSKEYSSIPNWWLDKQDPYGEEEPLSFSNGSVFVPFSDDPSFTLFIEYNYVEVDHQEFELFLMYKSNNTDSIWVPLAKMDWDWYGDAQYDDVNDVWFIVPGTSGHKTTNPIFTDTNDFPEYNNTATGTNPGWEKLEE